MINTKRHFLLSGLVCLGLLSACDYDKNQVQVIAGPAPSSGVRFFNFGINAPNVNFYANDTKLTAIVSTTGTESTSGTAYGAAASAGFYSGIAPGQYTFTGKISATTDKDLAISSIATSIADAKFYSYYISGFYNTATKTAEAFIVEDPLPAVDYSKAYVRFVNASPNSSPMVLSGLSLNDSTTVVTFGSAVAYKTAGAFTSVPVGSYDLRARVSGSAANAITRASVAFSGGKVYTISARGDMTVVSTTATNRPILDNTANR